MMDVHVGSKLSTTEGTEETEESSMVASLDCVSST
jgi:hypothetical protein